MFFLSFFQYLKSINISSKHTKSLCTSLVLDTKVKLGMVEFKAFYSTQSPGSPGHPLQTQVAFICFPLLASLPFARQTLHLLVFDFMAFYSSGASLFTGQWFLPVSLTMLSMATLDGFPSNLGAF